MKRHYGNPLSRILWGGTTLSPSERILLEALVSSLPPVLRTIAEAQFDAYNLVQREFGGRALNFYRKKDRKANNTEGLPVFQMEGVEEVPLARLTAMLEGEPEPVHATLAAVAGRVFCMSLSRKLPRFARSEVVRVVKVKQAWRSNFRLPEQTPNPSIEATS